MPEAAPAWYNPQTVVWATQPGKRAEYRSRVALGALYIKRECRVHIAHTEPTLSPAYTVEELRALVEWAVGEFAILAQHGIQVPKVDWHITKFEGRNRLVARVPVIEGTELAAAHIDPLYSEYRGRFPSYRADQSAGYRLADIADDQCIVGHPRLQRTNPILTDLWMVDSDLCQWEHGAEE